MAATVLWCDWHVSRREKPRHSSSRFYSLREYSLQYNIKEGMHLYTHNNNNNEWQDDDDVIKL